VNHAIDRLIASLDKTGAPVCVGIDPHLDRIPNEVWERAAHGSATPRDTVLAAVRTFCLDTLDIVRASDVRCVKPQVAFFEALGSHGMVVYEEVCARATTLGQFVIADIKRGDIGSTSAAYAEGWLNGANIRGHTLPPMPVDMITVSPFLGSDGVTPFVDAAAKSGRGIFALLKTSNPGSKDLQDQQLASGGLLYHELARLLERLGSKHIGERGYSLLGAVVGATHPDAAKAIRAMLPKTFFLVPGYGAQGGAAAELAPFFRDDGTGAVVNSSRGVIHAYGTSDFAGDWKASVGSAATALIKDVGAVIR